MIRNYQSCLIGFLGLLVMIIAFVLIIGKLSNNNYLIINNVDTSVTYTVRYELTCVPSKVGDYSAHVSYIDKVGHTIKHTVELPFTKVDTMYLRDPVLMSATLLSSSVNLSNSSCNFTCNIYINNDLWTTSTRNSSVFPEVECGGILATP